MPLWLESARLDRRAAGHLNRAQAKERFVRRRSPLRARAFSIQIKKMGSPTLRERRRRGMILDCHGPGSSSRHHPCRWPRPRLHVSPPDWQATVQRAGTAESARSTENGSRMQDSLHKETWGRKHRPRNYVHVAPTVNIPIATQANRLRPIIANRVAQFLEIFF